MPKVNHDERLKLIGKVKKITKQRMRLIEKVKRMSNSDCEEVLKKIMR